MPELVHMLLPVRGKDGNLFEPACYGRVREELTEMFGGVTAYSRAPAEGHWDSGKGVEQDDVMVIEVLVDRLDVDWWANYRRQLEARFKQDQILIRSVTCRVL